MGKNIAMEFTKSDLELLKVNLLNSYDYTRLQIARKKGKSMWDIRQKMGTTLRNLSVLSLNLITNGSLKISEENLNKVEVVIDNAIVNIAQLSMHLKSEIHTDITDRVKNMYWKVIGAIEFRREKRFFRSRVESSKYLNKYK